MLNFGCQLLKTFMCFQSLRVLLLLFVCFRIKTPSFKTCRGCESEVYTLILTLSKRNWVCRPTIPAFRKLSQGAQFEASLGNIMRYYFKTKHTNKNSRGETTKSKEMHSEIYRMYHKVLGHDTEGHRCYHRGRKLWGYTEENPRRKYLALGLRLCPGPGCCVLLSTHTQSESNRPTSLISLLGFPSSITQSFLMGTYDTWAPAS